MKQKTYGKFKTANGIPKSDKKSQILNSSCKKKS